MTEAGTQWSGRPDDQADRQPHRYFIDGWLFKPDGTSYSLRTIVASADPIEIERAPELLVANAADFSVTMKQGTAPKVSWFFPLLPIPRPPPGGTRPLLAWDVNVYFVCHDVKFGGDGSGVFGWPEEPAGEVLAQMVALLISDTLAERGDGPDGHQYSDVISVTVKPSPEPPSAYR